MTATSTRLHPLRVYRIIAGFETCADLARAANMSVTTVCRIESWASESFHKTTMDALYKVLRSEIPDLQMSDLFGFNRQSMLGRKAGSKVVSLEKPLPPRCPCGYVLPTGTHVCDECGYTDRPKPVATAMGAASA